MSWITSINDGSVNLTRQNHFQPFMKSAIILFIVIPVLLYLFFRWFERNSVWVPARAILDTPGAAGLDYEDVEFKTSDDVLLNGWYVPSEKDYATILFCHGNGGNIGHRVPSILQFHRLGFNVFIFDYRGYGRSEGWLTEKGTYLDAEAAYHWIRQHKPGSGIILFGRSLGASIAVHLATQVEADALICESGFTSIVDLGVELFPYLPVRWVSTIRYDTLSTIRKVNIPILIVHSPDDELIGIQHGRRLYEAAQPPKEFLQINGGHNEGFLTSEEIYLPGILGFLQKYKIIHLQGTESVPHSGEAGNRE
jgi:fermentation-respiration switch protein FrsA (DUF1100 family)